jgi:hypothetical protein
LDSFIVEIDYLTPEIRLLAPEHYSPPTRAVTLPLEFDGSRRPMIRARLVLEPGGALLSYLSLDTAVADQVLSLSKVFTDKEQILKRVRNVIQLRFRPTATSSSLPRVWPLLSRPVGLDNPVVMLFRTATAAPGHLPDGLLGSVFSFASWWRSMFLEPTSI